MRFACPFGLLPLGLRPPSGVVSVVGVAADSLLRMDRRRGLRGVALLPLKLYKTYDFKVNVCNFEIISNNWLHPKDRISACSSLLSASLMNLRTFFHGHGLKGILNPFTCTKDTCQWAVHGKFLLWPPSQPNHHKWRPSPSSLA